MLITAQIQLTQQIIIHHKHRYFSMLDELCFKSKNLYNYALHQIRQYYKQDRDFTIVSYVEFIAPKCIADLAESYARCVQLDGYELYGKDHFKKQGRYKDFESKALNYITEFLNSKNIDYKVVRK